VVQFLASQGFTVKHVPEMVVDPKLDQLAKFMGAHYTEIAPFLTRYKAAMNRDVTAYMNLKDLPGSQITSITQVARQLYELGFAQSFYYQKSPYYRLIVKPNRAINPNFITGAWLERYVYQEVSTALSQSGRRFEILANAQVLLPNQADFEIDLLVGIGSHHLWIEAKSGEYQSKLDKYAKIGQQMGLAPQSCFFVAAAAKPENLATLSNATQMSVVSLDQFSTSLGSYLQDLPR
jgi:hypothetical protein